MEQLTKYLGALGAWMVKICATVIAVGVVLVGVSGTVYLVVSVLMPKSIQIGMLEWIGLGEKSKSLRQKAMLSGDLDDARRETYPDVYSVAGKLANCTGYDVYWLVPSEFSKVYESTVVEQQQSAQLQQQGLQVQQWQAAQINSGFSS